MNYFARGWESEEFKVKLCIKNKNYIKYKNISIAINHIVTFIKRLFMYDNLCVLFAKVHGIGSM